jgi:signal transduction histidine kinase
MTIDRDSATLESVLCTEELERRPARSPDYGAENRALLALSRELLNSPDTVLQKLVDTALQLCRGHSAGVSLLEDGPPGDLSALGDHFRWHAVAGQWAPLTWTTTTRRDYGPCGTVLDRNRTLLFANAHRYYAQFAGVQPLLVEGLLVPFHVAGRAVGTVWVIAHDDTCKFDAEDQRVLESLATFAATAYETRLLIAAQVKGQEGLRDADRRKDEFLALLGHELRTPLGAIRSAAGALEQLATNTQERNMAAVVARGAQHLSRIVDELGDVARIGRGTLRLEPKRTTLQTVLASAVELTRSYIDARKHVLSVHVPRAAVVFEADTTRLTQLFSNLLHNAAKYTSPGGRIDVTAKVDGTAAEVRVRDTGAGIPSQDLPHVFKAFERRTGPSAAADGLGLGLMLVKRLAELHGGTVTAASDGAGRGSEFTVRLPLR